MSERSSFFKSNYYYKFNGPEIKLVKYTLEENTFRECPSASQNWVIMWSSGSIKSGIYQSLTKNQYVNHFPRSTEITRKDSLYKNIIRMQSLFGN